MRASYLLGGLIAAAAAASAANAQTGAQPSVYIGAQAGYHDLGDNPFGDDDGAIYGVYAGVDFPLGDAFVIGAEGNYNAGSGAIDSEYGVAGKLGYAMGRNSQLFLRGGYQWVDLDVRNLAQVVPGPIDDVAGDYLVGAGAQFGINDSVSLRAVVDTISFDSVRVTGGVAFHF